MNRPASDEYEEVESPFAQKTAKSQRIRTRKDVFNRPFATGSSVAPAVFETTATRKSIGHADNTELIEHRSSELSEQEIEYLDGEEEVEEEEEVVKKPARVPAAKSKTKAKASILPKLGWSLIGLLVLRLIFMDRGVWDWFSTENVIKEKKEELAELQRENKAIKAEIGRIQVDKGYQKQLAKEHLGVIAADEFLILFAGEVPETTPADDRQI